MRSYMITYDLKKPERNYESLYELIKECGTWWHYLESTWLVRTEMPSKEIYKKISAALDKDDKVLIMEVGGGWYGLLPQKALDWIRENI